MGMKAQTDYTCINLGPNNINTMPTNYIIWKMIQLFLTYHPFAGIKTNSIKVFGYFK
jgi:hypothetical protein